MRYYVIAIQYNYIAEAENRTTPKAYNTENEAIREFHRQLSSDMGNETLGWSLCMIFNTVGDIIKKERWEREGIFEEPSTE